MALTNRIPFLDLVAPHRELERELTEIFNQALHTATFVGGPMVEEFERHFAALCGTRYAVGVSSGTDAVRLAVIASGVTPGDVVVTVPNTFIATTEAVSQAGAIPEFVDIDEATYNMSPEALRMFLETQCTRHATGELISKRHGRPVRAVLPVHLYGQMANMDVISGLAEEYGLTVLEDACQAHGSQYYSSQHDRWLTAGSVGAAAAFSFYPGKNLGGCGEGGAVTTNDTSLADRIRVLRDHGQSTKYYHIYEGYNARLDSIQAGVLDMKLRHLTDWNDRRRELAAAYNRMLAGLDSIICPYEPSWSRAVYHLYVIRTSARETLITHLKEAGIGTGIHYPVPLHLQQAYRSLKYKRGDFPVAESAADQVASLPMFPQLTEAQQERVVEEIYASVGRAVGNQPLSPQVVGSPSFRRDE